MTRQRPDRQTVIPARPGNLSVIDGLFGSRDYCLDLGDSAPMHRSAQRTMLIRDCESGLGSVMSFAERWLWRPETRNTQVCGA